jgi:deoxyribonuclease V
MKLNPPAIRHRWDLTPQEAMALQSQLSGRIIRKSAIRPEDVVTVAGIDAHYRDNLSLAVAVIIKLPDLETVEYATAVKRIRFTYIPGLLTFREGPAILDALNNLAATPDLLMFDGQGIAHPRRCGLASHIGLLLDRPSIGCAKTLLSGCYQEPGTEKGCYSFLKDRDETIGAVVRTRNGVRPLFVSIGHRMNLQDSIRIVLKCCVKYRMPETLRRADQLAREELKHIAPGKK